jgi:hypothetical protein
MDFLNVPEDLQRIPEVYLVGQLIEIVQVDCMMLDVGLHVLAVELALREDLEGFVGGLSCLVPDGALPAALPDVPPELEAGLGHHVLVVGLGGLLKPEATSIVLHIVELVVDIVEVALALESDDGFLAVFIVLQFDLGHWGAVLD